MEKKHAYLIIAHNNFYCLEKLLLLLDDERNDIFLHIDKKVKDFDFSYFEHLCKKATLYFPARRNKVYWGTQSQILTELLLFKTAYSKGPYSYYHLISGVDLPLKTQNEIHAFFDTASASHLCYAPKPSKWDVHRISRYHRLFPGKSWISERINGWLGKLQERLGTDRLKNTGLTPQKGGNWASLTQDAVEYLIANEKRIRKITRFTSCADEVYKQTLLVSAGFPVDPEDFRYMVNFPGTNHPKVFTSEDFDDLISQEKFFARKFDADKHRQIVDMIFDYLKKDE